MATCDVCDTPDVEVAPVQFCGGVTFACDKCRADPLREEMDRDFHNAVQQSKQMDRIFDVLFGAPPCKP